MTKPSYIGKVAVATMQSELRLGALDVFVTEIPKDGLGNRGVSFCMMDALGQFGTVRLDMLPEAAKFLASLLLDCADACERNELNEKLRAAAAALQKKEDTDEEPPK